MKTKSLILAAALAALALPAAAADMPAKAPPPAAPSLLSPYSGSGPYVGFNTGGGGGSASMTQANVVSLQGLVGLTVGYAWSLQGGASFAAVEADFDVMNLSTGSAAGLTFNGPVDLEQRVLYGFPVQTALQMLPILGNLFGNLTLSPFQPLQPGVTATNSHMYLFAGVDEKDVSANLGGTSHKTWLIAPEVGFGNRVQLNNGFAMDTSLAAQFDSRGACVGAPLVGAECGNIGTAFIGKLKLIY